MPYIGKQLSNGNYLKLDDISSQFNGTKLTFNLTNGGSAYYPGSELSILVSVGGVIQEPESAYQISNDEITFANAPTAQDSFFCVVLGDAIGINVPGNNTVNGAQMAKPFNYDGGLLYLDDSNNKIGINNTSPTVALDITGDLKVSGNITGIGGTLGGTLTGNVYASSGISTFYDLRVTNNLTVEGTTTTLDTNLIGVDRVEVGANSNSIVGVAVTQSGTADILQLFDGTSKVVTVDDEGKVGIGTENPEVKLHLVGDRLQVDDTGNPFMGRRFNAAADGAILFLEHSRSNTIGTKVKLNDNDEIGSIQFRAYKSDNSTIGNAASIKAEVNGTTSANGVPADLIFNTGTTSSNATEKLRITSGGKIGINNASPTSQLDGANDLVIGDTSDADSGITLVSTTSGQGLIHFSDATSGNARYDGFIGYEQTARALKFGTAQAERIRIFSTGRIGIGTNTAPRDMVHIHNPTAGSSSYVQFTNANTGGTGSNDGTLIGISQNNSNTDGTGSGFTILQKENAELTLGTNGLERLRITSAGNVAIGTNTSNNILRIFYTDATVWPFDSTVSGSPTYTPYSNEVVLQNNVRDTEGSFAGIFFRAGADDTGNKHGTARIAAVETGNYKADLVFGTRNTTFAERLRIKSDGNVVAAANIKSNNLAGHNIIHNGEMAIWQRGSTSINTSQNKYLVDRFKAMSSTDGNGAVHQHTNVPTQVQTGGSQFAYSLRVNCTTADTSLAANQYIIISQRIEGVDLRQLGFGLAGTRYATLSFWQRSNSGTYHVSFRNESYNRYYLASYTAANHTWEKHEITIPIDTSGTWNSANGTGLDIQWSLGAGSNNSGGTVGSWSGGSKHAGSSQKNFFDSTSNDFYLTGVQFEKGTIATPFEHKTYAEDLRICQRYFQRVQGGLFGIGASSTTIRSNYIPIVNFRATPTITGNASVTFNNPGINSPTQSSFNCGIQFTPSSLDNIGMTLGFGNYSNATQGYTYIQWDSDDEHIDFSAEP